MVRENGVMVLERDGYVVLHSPTNGLALTVLAW
jgi:hypothetical protein